MELWAAATGRTAYQEAGSPAVAKGIVYVGSNDHKLYAFKATNGQKLWSAPTGDTITSSPAVANGVVYVGSWDHKLYAFNATSGRKLLSAITAGPSHPPPPS